MSQNEQILSYLRRNGSITQADAVGFGCFRLAARIPELKKQGHRIIPQRESHEGGSHSRYFLVA